MNSTCMRLFLAVCVTSSFTACDAHREPEPGAAVEAPAPAAGSARAAAVVDSAAGGPPGQPADPAPAPADPAPIPVETRPQPIADADAPQASEPKASSAAPGRNGRAVFMDKCKGCHGEDGKADTKMGRKHDVPDATVPDWDRRWPLSKIIKIVNHGKAGTKMRPFSEKLSAAEIEAVSKFMRAL